MERFDCPRGSALLVHRLALLDRLAGHVHTAYGQVASGEAANVTYASTLGDLPQVEDREELKGWAYERMLAALMSTPTRKFAAA